MNKKKIDYLKEGFQKEGYNLSAEDIKDLEKQLTRKCVLLYCLSIEYCKQEKIPITYENISELIKVNIRIRNELRNLVTSLEEMLRAKYCDLENGKFIDEEKIEKFNKLTFNKILKKIYSKEDGKDWHEIREMRNDVSHISYPILNSKIYEYITSLNKISDKENVDKETIDNYIKRISNYIADFCKRKEVKNNLVCIFT